MRHLPSVLILAACRHAAPSPATQPVSVATPPPDAFLPLDAAPAMDASPVIDAAPEGCVDPARLPGTPRSTGADLWYCDTPERVVLVTWPPDKRTTSIVAIPRAHPAHRVPGHITSYSCNDPCNGPGGGWAGCSALQQCTVHTDVPGARVLETARPRSDLPLAVILAVGDDLRHVSACGPQPHYIDSEPAAICSTPHHTAVLDWTDCSTSTSLMRLQISVFGPGGRPIRDDTSKPQLQRDGALDRRASDDSHRVYRFPEPGAGDVVLALDTIGKPTATLAIGDDVETCFAFQGL